MRNICINKFVPCSESRWSTTWKWGPLTGSSLTMKLLHVWKVYITTEVFCSTNSMVHVTKRTRRRGACFPYPRPTWWAPRRHTVSSWSQDKSTYTFKERNHTARLRRGGGACGALARLRPRVPREGTSGLVRTNAYASFPQSYRFRKKV